MDFLKNNKLNILLISGWIFAVLCAVYFHEIWRDEAQAWCIARDAGFFEMLKITAVEGHPFLWHLILMPFSKAGMPVLSMQIISLLFVFAAVIYLVFKSPFSYLIKISAVFSCGMVYFLPVIARNYALIPLFLFIAADLYPKRHNHPVKYAAALILLSNTHALIFGLSAALSILFLYESIKKAFKENNLRAVMPSSAAAGFLFLISFFLSGSLSKSWVFVNQLKTQMPFIDAVKEFPAQFFVLPAFFCVLIFYALLTVCAFEFFKYSKKIFFIFISGFSGVFFIFCKIGFHGITGQKAYILFSVLLFCLWIFNAEYKNKALEFAAAALLIISCINSFYWLPQDIIYNFSGSKDTAEYIKNNLNDEKIFCTIGAPMTFTPIAAYLPDKKFYSLINKYYYSYSDFNVKTSKQAAAEPLCRYYIVQKDFYMNNNYKIIFTGSSYILDSGEFAETFAVYKKK